MSPRLALFQNLKLIAPPYLLEHNRIQWSCANKTNRNKN